MKEYDAELLLLTEYYDINRCQKLIRGSNFFSVMQICLFPFFCVCSVVPFSSDTTQQYNTVWSFKGSLIGGYRSFLKGV